MPLTKLFQRSNSSQKDRKKSLTSAELSASDSTAEESCTNQPEQIQTATDSENYRLEDKRKSNDESENSKSSDIETETDNRNGETSDSTEQSDTSRKCSVPEVSDAVEQVRNKSRSISLKESGTKPNVQRTRRRKCESESAAFSSTDDEGFEDKIIQLRERDLEKVIGQCVDRLIRESILTAVKSVKVDNLYEDVIKSLSRSASESSDSSGAPETIQQKLHTDSVTEYADLQMVHTFEEEKLDEEESNETHSSNQKRDSEASSEASDHTQSENDNNKCAEIKESSTSTEFDLSSEDKMIDLKMPFETSESNDGLNPVIQDANNSTKSFENCESSACLNQNENISTNIQIDGSDQIDKLVKSDKIDIKDEEFHENDKCEQMKDIKVCQENTVPTEIPEKSEQNETSENTTDCSRLVKQQTSQAEHNEDVRESTGELEDETEDSKIESEEVKDISAEAYHADIEESTSLHSMASESSFENIKVDATQKKVIDDSPKPQIDDMKVVKKLSVEGDLMAMSGDDFSHLLTSESTIEEESTPVNDLGENLPEQKPTEEEKKVNWKVGYLRVKLPHKSRHKGLKVWKKRCVAIQPDEFASDDSDPCLVLSVYSGDSSAAKKHSASFWKSISCQKAVIYRSSSRTHPYAFTISDDKKAVIHLAVDSEAIAQEWMAAIRAILWPPSPVIQLEKMLNGREFEISIIDNEFSYRAGLLGMYGYLTITPKKLILVHPQQGFVIQEWYLNTIDKFQLIQQTRIEDINKVLSMTTCSDSSTGKGDLLIFCREAVSLLQAIASTIHQILTHHSVQEGGKYQKELEEIGEWLVADTATATEDYYKVPPRQVKSLLDIPNFIFNKPLPQGATEGVTVVSQKSNLDVPNADPTRSSQDSGILPEIVTDDFLNCSVTSFVVGDEPFPGKSSDSELSDTYTPPRSPEVKSKRAEAAEATANA